MAEPERIGNLLRAVAPTGAGGTGAGPSTTCPYKACDGSGLIPVEGDNGYHAVRECRCLAERRQRERIQRLFRQAEVPRRYAGKTLDTFSRSWQQAAWRVARQYVDHFETIRQQPRNGLLFIGPVGTGKTHLVYAIVQELVARNVPALCQNVPDLMDLLRPGSGKPQESAERLELAKTLDLLALDDLGAERETPWVTERLYVLINARYNAMLPTLVTSNVELEELELTPGWERLVSRLLEMCHLVVVDGPDYRKEGGDRDGRDTRGAASRHRGRGDRPVTTERGDGPAAGGRSGV